MGQAVVDLPDPTQETPAGANADDLLSQLAGDEIDRLLGEAEVENASADEAAAAAEAPAAEAAAPVDPLAEPLAATPAPPTDMAALLDEAKAETPAEPTPDAAEPVATPAPASELDQTIAAHADTVLGPSPTAAEPEREELLSDELADAADEQPSLPLLLRPLEWFSSPLDSLSPATRDFLGKAAIVTLVNSAAVIAYVIWFRK